MFQESNGATTLCEENDKYQVYHQAPSTTTHRQIHAKFPLSDTKLGHLIIIIIIILIIIIAIVIQFLLFAAACLRYSA